MTQLSLSCYCIESEKLNLVISCARFYCSFEATTVLLPIQIIQGIIKLEGWRKTGKYFFLILFSHLGLCIMSEAIEDFLETYYCKILTVTPKLIKEKMSKILFSINTMSPYLLYFCFSHLPFNSLHFFNLLLEKN